MTLNYGMAHQSFCGTSAYLKVLHKGRTVIDTGGSVKPMEKVYYDLLKSKKLKPYNLNKYLNYKSDSINFLKTYCDTLIQHYPTYKGDKVLRKKTNENVVFQFYYSVVTVLKYVIKRKNMI